MSLDLPRAQRVDPTGIFPPHERLKQRTEPVPKRQGAYISEPEVEIKGVASASPDRRWGPMRLALSEKHPEESLVP